MKSSNATGRRSGSQDDDLKDMMERYVYWTAAPVFGITAVAHD
ncbi:hypothetical protein [Neisseria subflava]|nr:hypothetical protein [Neisseria subflava]